MHILNIAGYKFVALSELPDLCEQLLIKCNDLAVKGTILLSPEGINISLAAMRENIEAFQQYLQADERFADMTFRESYSDFLPFNHMKVKIKKEIITMRRDDVQPQVAARAPSLLPEEFKQWLDEGRDITILDTRNDYEVRFGTFRNALNLQIDDFSEFPSAAARVAQDKPIVMFCTGGIRCEKAALHMMNNGHTNVYQLHGGILNYFSKVGGEHYDGECFVFDERVSLNASLQMTGTQQCTVCEGPMQASLCNQCN
jgi:UPF0176 protein